VVAFPAPSDSLSEMPETPVLAVARTCLFRPTGYSRFLSRLEWVAGTGKRHGDSLSTHCWQYHNKR